MEEEQVMKNTIRVIGQRDEGVRVVEEVNG
jgi:hypothetical protein